MKPFRYERAGSLRLCLRIGDGAYGQGSSPAAPTCSIS